MYRRFECQQCHARRDQSLRQNNTTEIRCVCGGTAIATTEVMRDKPIIDWWVDSKGWYQWLELRQSSKPLNFGNKKRTWLDKLLGR